LAGLAVDVELEQQRTWKSHPRLCLHNIAYLVARDLQHLADPFVSVAGCLQGNHVAAGLQRYMKNTLGRHSMTARPLSMTRQLTSWVEASKLTVSDDAVVDGEEEPTSGTNAQRWSQHKIQSRTALANAQRRSTYSIV